MLTDSLLNHETVKYFDAEPVVCNRYDSRWAAPNRRGDVSSATCGERI